jgi:DNA (cytosine-5)-methyltransferase 1
MRVVREVGCEWCFLENVPPVLAFPAGHSVLRELAESGFDAEWVSVRASDVGAPHKRERVFILANSASIRLHARWEEFAVEDSYGTTNDNRGCGTPLAHRTSGGLGMLRESSRRAGFTGGGNS